MGRKIVIGLIWAVMISLTTGLVAGLSNADELGIRDTLAKIPALKSGVAFNVLDSEWEYTETLNLLQYKGFNLDAGYTTKDKAIGAITYELLNLKDLGVTVPVLDLIKIEPGIYAGLGRVAIGQGNAKDNNEFSFGTIINFIDIKF